MLAAVSSSEIERTTRLVESLKRRVAKLEDELYAAEQEEDRLRAFSMHRVDELVALGAWVPGQSEEETRQWREQHFMW